MAHALNNTVPSVDVESLLWEMRDIIRGLCQVTKAQSAEIERLGGTQRLSLVAEEYDERAQAAIQSVDAVLDQLDSDDQSVEAYDGDDNESGTDYDVHVAAWVQATNASFSLPQPETLSIAPTPTKEVPTDFWAVHDFNWDEEPLDDDSIDASPAPVVDSPFGFVDPTFDEWDETEEDDLSPSDSISERDVDEDDSSSSSSPSPSTPTSSSHDDSATLFHPSEEDSAVIRAVERHAFVSGQKARAMVTAALKAADLDTHFGHHHGFEQPAMTLENTIPVF